MEKFNYLKGYLEGAAAKTIEGISLSNENYAKALDALKARYGNKQVIISSHMQHLLNIKAVTSMNDVKGMRAIYDNLESHVRSLLSLGVDSKHYGTLLIPVVMEKLPSEVRLVVSRKFGDEEWDLQLLLNYLKSEIQAREYCAFSVASSHSDKSEKDQNNKKQTNRPFTASALLTESQSQSKKGKCAFCDGEHFASKCTVISDVKARKAFVREKRKCFNCLRDNHISKNCKSVNRCHNCKGHHHTAICDNNSRQEHPPEETNTMHIGANTSVLLQTAQAVITDARGDKQIQVKMMFDSCSQRTFVSERVRKFLQLESLGKEHLCIKTFGSDKKDASDLDLVKFHVKSLSGDTNTELCGLAIPFICSPIAKQPLSFAKHYYPHLRGLELADNNEDNCEIDLLIGADNYWGMVTGTVRRGESGPMAVKTSLGWVLSGPTRNLDNCAVNVNAAHVMRVESERVERDVQNEQLHKFWDLESLGIKAQEDTVYDRFINEIEFKSDAWRYQVKLPFKEEHALIEDNYTLCEKRLEHTHRMLKKQPETLREYDRVMKDQLEAGVVEEVSTTGEPGKTHYLPHRAVIREDKKSTKLRVVFDASAKNNGPSLNDCLYKGPPMTPQLYNILMRFRTYQIALTADVEKAFLQILVAPEDRDYMRFLWYKDPFSDNPEAVRYRFARVIFGVNSSPFLLNGTLRVHMERFNTVDPEFVKKVLRSVYMDDLSLGGDSLDETYTLCKKPKLRFLEGNFNLRKCRTNSEELRSIIKEESQEDETQSTFLGVEWNEGRDELIFTFENILREVSIMRKSLRETF